MMSDDRSAGANGEPDETPSVHSAGLSLTEAPSTRRAALGITAAAAAVLADRAISPSSARATEEIVKSVNKKTGVVEGIAEVNTEGPEKGKLLESQIPSSVESGSFTGDATGATDIGPALQEAFEKQAFVSLKRNGIYLINSPVFLDSTNANAKYVLDCNGATIKFGAELPSASGMKGGQAGTKWAFFPNTLRSALAAGEVTTTESTRATGSTYPPYTRLIIKNGLLDSQKNIVGLIFNNTCNARIEDCILKNIQYGISWVGYSDGNVCENVQTIGTGVIGSTTPSTLIYQREHGDGTSAIHCKMASQVKEEAGGPGVHLDLENCYGFRVASAISGQILLKESVGVIEASHQDTDNEDEPSLSVLLVGTKLSYVGSRSNASHNAGKPTIRIEDEAGKPSTWLDLIDHTELFHTAAPLPDTSRGATIEIVSLNEGGRIRSTGLKTVLGASPEEELEGPYLTSSVTGITAALAAGMDQIATGDFLLYNTGTVWLVVPPSGAPLPLKTLKTPIFGEIAKSASISGVLEEKQQYEYVMACKSADGRYTALSAERHSEGGKKGAILLSLTNPSNPCVIAIWRYAGTGKVKTTPDHYIEIPLTGVVTTWCDTGTHINGRPWKTTGIPEPTAVAGPAATSNTLDPAGALFSTFDRSTATIGSTAPETGKATMALVKHPGGLLTNLNMLTGTTAGKGVTHAWMALTNRLGEVVAITEDHNALAASTTFTWPVTEPLNLPPGVYYAVVMIAATETMPTLLGVTGSGLAAKAIPPIVTGVSTSVGLTAPPKVGEHIPVPTAGTTFVPYIWGT
jgi:hypothetical protein